jgi:hypothetical protein
MYRVYDIDIIPGFIEEKRHEKPIPGKGNTDGGAIL